MGTLPPASFSGPAPDQDDKPLGNIKIALLIWLMAWPIVAALLGGVGLQSREARWSRALASAARMNGAAAPPGASLTAICADPVLALPSCINVAVIKALLVTASVATVLGLALIGGILVARRRAAGDPSRLVRAFRPTLSLAIGAVCTLLVLNAAMVLMAMSMAPLSRSIGKLVVSGVIVAFGMLIGAVRLGRVGFSLRHPETAPPRHLVVGLTPIDRDAIVTLYLLIGHAEHVAWQAFLLRPFYYAIEAFLDAFRAAALATGRNIGVTQEEIRERGASVFGQDGTFVSRWVATPGGMLTAILIMSLAIPPVPWFPPKPSVGQRVPPLPVMPDVPERAALLGLLRDRQYDALERELTDAVRRSRKGPGDEVIATTAFRTFWIADPSITELLDEWVGLHDDSPMAYLARARHSAALGWAARGTGWARETSPGQFAAMRLHHVNARRDLREALKRDPALVEAHAELIQLAKDDLGQCEDVGAAALRAAPASYRVRAVILDCLEPRWGGSLERMRAFALVSQHYARENPRLSALLGYVEMEIGRELASKKRHVDAIGAYTVALSRGPAGMFYNFRAASNRALGYHERALADTDAALTLIPQDPETLADRARTLNELGRQAEATESIALAARLDPTDPDIQKWSQYLLQRAVVGHGKEGMTANASQAFDTALQVDPNNVETFYWRGRAYIKSGDLVRAQEDFQRAVAIDRTHFESYRNLDWLFSREQRWDEVIAMWTEYLALKPNDGTAYLHRAGARRRKGDMTQAIADVRRACELGNTDACAIAQSLPAQPGTSN